MQTNYETIHPKSDDTNYSLASLLNGELELCRMIFEQLLPEEVDAKLLFKEIPKVNTNSRAITLIDQAIKNLEPSLKQNNTLLGFSLNSFITNSDVQISILNNLKESIKTDNLSAIKTHEKENKITQPSHLSHYFFKQPSVKTKETIQDVKYILGLLEKHPKSEQNKTHL